MMTIYLFIVNCVYSNVQTNRSVENIGARRLHTVIERVVEDISFEAPERKGETVVIDAAYVQSKVQSLLTATDLRKYIL